jgi:hypothetical protein
MDLVNLLLYAATIVPQFNDQSDMTTLCCIGGA